MNPWVLAIDFGTTNTVASVGDDSGVRTLNVDGRPVMPSAVFLERVDRPGSPDSWTVGEPAVHLARRRLDQFEANPKKCVAAGSIFLGGRDVPVTDAIAALLHPFVEEAASQFPRQAPAVVLLTHPASWAAPRVEILRQALRAAAEKRRWPEPVTLPEPVAAAQRTLGVPDVPAHVRLVVLDFGGGTVDVSVVDRRASTVTVVGRPAGLDSLGGEDFDLRLAEWMCEEVGHPGLFQRMSASSDPDQRERAVELRAHARTVKEELSKRTVVHGQVYRSPPELPETVPVQVSRDQLEQLINGGPGHRPGLTEAVGLVDRAMREAPPGPPFGGVFLVGGSSRISRLGVLVIERTGRPPIQHGDPTIAVSYGAAEFCLRHVREQAPASAQARSQAQPAPPPVSVPPAAPPPPADPPPVPVPGPGFAAAPRRRGRGRTVTVLAALAVLLGGVGVAAYAANREEPYICSDGTEVSDSYYCPSTTEGSLTGTVDPTDTATAEPTETAATVEPAETETTTTGASGLAGCDLSESGCTSSVISDSGVVWPAIAATSSCDVVDGFYDAGVDRRTTWCTGSSGAKYGLVWRSSSAGYPAVAELYANWIGVSLDPFTLLGSGDVLGAWAQGSVVANDGTPRYVCVAEYEDYPVAMVIDGPDDGTVSDECTSALFNERSDMAALDW
ncbi:hypothetical protein ACTI_62590 [Actinoplanes sp. OR16]|uniref:Hsp70 family protein n=1 Tax=Actinoplanes sp. OR16 TaxID=946334 RepID=UPI000F6B5240|nr:Hsp70 family protein [Actinoplanes sp. OR16]BBH69574.1 hypothetical protein ACTI_62590 [Actinoplanes sp. OR16]